jgi:hypothetical protein
MTEKIIIKAKTKKFEINKQLLCTNSNFFKSTSKLNPSNVYDFSYISDEVVQYLSDFLLNKHKPYQLKTIQILDEAYKFAELIQFFDLECSLGGETEELEIYEKFIKNGTESLSFVDESQAEKLLKRLEDKPELQKQVKEYFEREIIYGFWLEDGLERFIAQDPPRELLDELSNTIKKFIKEKREIVDNDILNMIELKDIQNIDMNLVKKDLVGFCRLHNKGEIDEFLKKQETPKSSENNKKKNNKKKK